MRRIAKQPIACLAAATGLVCVGLAFTSGAAAIRPASDVRLAERGRCPSASGHDIVLTVPLPGRPGYLLLTKKTLWVAIRGSRLGGRGKVMGFDPGSGRVQASFSIPVDPYRLAFAFGSLWIRDAAPRSTYGGAVLRVDPRSGRVLRVVRGPRLFGSALAATADAVWVGGIDTYPAGQPNNTLARLIFAIDPVRNAVRQVYLTPTTVTDLLGDGRSLWATGWGAVVKLSPSGRLLYEQRFGGSAWAMALARGGVWVAEPLSGTRRSVRAQREQKPARRLLRVMTSGPQRLTVVELAAPPGDVGASGDVAWTGDMRIDETQTPPTLTPIMLRGVGMRVEAFRGGGWFSERDPTELSKIC
jgi:hypothetical protein